MKAKNMQQVKQRAPLYSYNSKNQLCFAGKRLSLWTRDWQKPIYLYSRKVIRERLASFQKKVTQALGKRPTLHYAMKANSHPMILQLMRQNKIGVDVVSAGEMQKALLAKIPTRDILFSGVAKTEAELKLALRKKLGQLNVESLSELQRVLRLSERMQAKRPTKLKIGLRVNPEVNPDTHPYIATGFRENKFGLEFSQVPEALAMLAKQRQIEFAGLSLHIGSQLFDFAALGEAIEKTLQLEDQLRKGGTVCTSLDIGGGVGVRYDLDATLSDEKTLDDFCQVLKKKLHNYPGEIRLEPGRFLVARAGVLLTQIQYLKRNSHKNFLICDTGMHHLLRPALYQAQHRIMPLVARAQAREKFDIVGPVCESSDVLGVQRELPTPEEADFLAILDVGAYGYCMASDYNSFAKPVEIFF